MRKNWTAMQNQAIEVASNLGHNVVDFNGQRRNPSVKTGSCETCGGCCWVANKGDRMSAGGRILAYRCGTKEASGVL